MSIFPFGKARKCRHLLLLKRFIEIKWPGVEQRRRLLWLKLVYSTPRQRFVHKITNENRTWEMNTITSALGCLQNQHLRNFFFVTHSARQSAVAKFLYKTFSRIIDKSSLFCSRWQSYKDELFVDEKRYWYRLSRSLNGSFSWKANFLPATSIKRKDFPHLYTIISDSFHLPIKVLTSWLSIYCGVKNGGQWRKLLSTESDECAYVIDKHCISDTPNLTFDYIYSLFTSSPFFLY